MSDLKRAADDLAAELSASLERGIRHMISVPMAERAARTWCDKFTSTPFDDLDEEGKTAAVSDFREVLASALSQQPSAVVGRGAWDAATIRQQADGVPEGAAIEVPVIHGHDEDCNCRAVGYAEGWNAMLAAAPKPAGGEPNG